MELHNVVQGSKEWHLLRSDHKTASEASAMMGESKYQSRDELLQQKATGEAKEISEFTQKIFDKGHAAEAAIRPHVEAIVEEELFPATGTDSGYLASFDGIDMLETIVFEHKLWNEKLAETVRNQVLEAHYYWQLEQQLMVSGAEKAIFVVSDGTPEKMVYMHYLPVEGRKEALIAGWAQFDVDLKNFNPQTYAEKPEAAPVAELPALIYNLNGTALSSNLIDYKSAAESLVAESERPLENDQDFSDRELLVKKFKEAEDNIKIVTGQVVGELKDVDKFCKDLEYIGAQIRQARLNGEKAVKARKEEIKRDIANKAAEEFNEYCLEINKRFSDISWLSVRLLLPRIEFNPTLAAKGKRTIKGLNESINDSLALAKIEASNHEALFLSNIDVYVDYNADYSFLFPDLGNLINNNTEAFTAIVKARIDEHEAAARAKEEARKEEEAKRLEQERERIRQEEEAKARRKMAEEIAAQRVQEERHELTCSREFANNQAPEPLPEPKSKIESSFVERVESAAPGLLKGRPSPRFIPSDTSGTFDPTDIMNELSFLFGEGQIKNLSTDEHGTNYLLEVSVKRISIK